jgi:CysZ protein
LPLIFNAMGKAARDLARPNVLLLIAVPVVCAAAMWALLGWLFWERLGAWINGLLLATSFGRWIAEWAGGALRVVSAILVLALLAPGAMLTALLVTEFFALPALINFVARQYYPALARERGGSAAASIRNTGAAVAIFMLLWVVTLPLWFTGIGALLVPAMNSAYLNQRVFRYDTLAEHASRDELETLVNSNRRCLYFLALSLAAFNYVPLVNLVAPALTGLAFTHFQLGALARLREQRLSAAPSPSPSALPASGRGDCVR